MKQATFIITVNEDGSSNVTLNSDLKIPISTVIGLLADYQSKLSAVVLDYYKGLNPIPESLYMSLTVEELFKKY